MSTDSGLKQVDQMLIGAIQLLEARADSCFSDFQGFPNGDATFNSGFVQSVRAYSGSAY